MSSHDLRPDRVRPGQDRRRTWVRLDNASNIFLAARSDRDPQVFRLTAELDHEVDPELLQAALDKTYDRYPLYHAVLRRGVFWYYLQSSRLRPQAVPDELPSCAPIFQPDRRTLLFRVLHHRRRIALELFHVLSDGMGALTFFSDLVNRYAELHAERSGRKAGMPGREGTEGPAGRSDAGGTGDEEELDEAGRGLVADSFTHYFRRRRGQPDHGAGLAPEPEPSSPDPSSPDPSSPEPDQSERHRSEPHGKRPSNEPARPRQRVYRVRGTRTPDGRPRLVELTMPSDQVLSLARAERVSITMYLTAVLFEAVRRSSGGLGRATTLAAVVPVNLRQAFPSTSSRNFFATIRIEHTYGAGADDLGTVCRELDAKFRRRATPHALERQVRRFIRFERMPLLRIVPRPLKDLVLGMIYRLDGRGLTAAVSNLGRVQLPEPADSQVGRILLHTSTVRPQLCLVSHAGQLTVSYTSPYLETDLVREFARVLTAAGVDVTVVAPPVTEAELAEVTG